MTTSKLFDPVGVILVAAEAEWLIHAADSWEDIDFRGWPRGFHRSAWVIAGFVGWNPLDVLDAPSPAARVVNALVTRRCLALVAATVHAVPDPGDAAEPLLAWFNAAVGEHQFDITRTVEDAGDVAWQLPRSRRHAARRRGVRRLHGFPAPLT